MRIKDLPLRWILLGLIVVPFGVHRIRLALRSTEESVRARIEYVAGALKAREAKRIRRAIPKDFVDESSHHGRREIVDAARALTLGSTRYRATLDPNDGIEFLTPPEDGTKAVTVSLHMTIDARDGESGYKPWWEVTLIADLELREGSWMIVATRDVNHSDRPRGY